MQGKLSMIAFLAGAVSLSTIGGCDKGKTAETTQPASAPTTKASEASEQSPGPASPPAQVTTGETLHDAAKNGDLVQVQTLLSIGTPVDQKDSRGSTALIYAARNGYVEIVKLLLDKGAQVDSRDGIAQATPLIWAAYGNNDAVVRLLLQHGADINATAADGMSALDAAIHTDATLAEATLKSFGAKGNSADGPITLAGLNKLGDILLDNREFHPIEDCTITLSGGFKTHIGYFGARDRLAMPASEFKRNDGTSFSKESSKVPTIISEECNGD